MYNKPKGGAGSPGNLYSTTCISTSKALPAAQAPDPYLILENSCIIRLFAEVPNHEMFTVALLKNFGDFSSFIL